MVTAINRDGTGAGFDLELTQRIAPAVPIPVIASGGAGTVRHIVDVIQTGKADAVAVASILHYEYLRIHPEIIGDFEEGNVDFLRKPRQLGNIEGASLEDIKQTLMAHGIPVRPRESTHV